MRQSIIAPIIVLAGWGLCQNVSALTFDFAVNDGGFTTSASVIGVFSSWSYTGANWETTNIDGTSAFLTSPVLTESSSSSEITLTHSYDFEEVGDFIDGGRLEVSVNGNPYQVVTPNGGYPMDGDGVDIFGFGEEGWGGNSNGEVTDTAALSVSPGDSLQFRLHAAWDVGVHPVNPNWSIASILVTQVPEPATFIVCLIGIAAIATWIRPRPTGIDFES